MIDLRCFRCCEHMSVLGCCGGHVLRNGEDTSRLACFVPPPYGGAIIDELTGRLIGQGLDDSAEIRPSNEALTRKTGPEFPALVGLLSSGPAPYPIPPAATPVPLSPAGQALREAAEPPGSHTEPGADEQAPPPPAAAPAGHCLPVNRCDSPEAGSATGSGEPRPAREAAGTSRGPLPAGYYANGRFQTSDFPVRGPKGRLQAQKKETPGTCEGLAVPVACNLKPEPFPPCRGEPPDSAGVRLGSTQARDSRGGRAAVCGRADLAGLLLCLCGQSEMAMATEGPSKPRPAGTHGTRPARPGGLVKAEGGRRKDEVKSFAGSAPGLYPLLAAMRQVESGGNDNAVGDGGRSIGPYQIQLAYWTDGGGDARRYRLDAWHADRCRPVIMAYWRRYCPAALARADLETLARVHNGGPNGARSAATLAYWRRVQAAMTAGGER